MGEISALPAVVATPQPHHTSPPQIEHTFQLRAL